MVFVLLTYGGWNEAAYLSAELKDERRNMVRILAYSIIAVTVLYFWSPIAYLRTRRASTALRGLQRHRHRCDAPRRSAGAARAVIAVADLRFGHQHPQRHHLHRRPHLLRRWASDLPHAALFSGVWNATRSKTPPMPSCLQGAVALGLVALVGARQPRRLRGDGGLYRPGLLAVHDAGRASRCSCFRRREAEARRRRLPRALLSR